jgi:hypothetical protein
MDQEMAQVHQVEAGRRKRILGDVVVPHFAASGVQEPGLQIGGHDSSLRANLLRQPVGDGAGPGADLQALPICTDPDRH